MSIFLTIYFIGYVLVFVLCSIVAFNEDELDWRTLRDLSILSLGSFILIIAVAYYFIFDKE